MENNAGKRKADEELKKTTEKRNKAVTTPRSTRNNPSPGMASLDNTPSSNGSEQSTMSLILDLKNHMSEITRESTSKWSSLVDQVNGKVEKNSADICEIKKSIERIERNQAEMGSLSPSTVGVANQFVSGQRTKYDFARRSLRLWPVRGVEEGEIRSEAIRFIRTKLLVDEATCLNNQVERVRRTRQPKRSKGRVNNEVLITFVDKFARDSVAAGAKNLAEYKDELGNPTAGLRMNYPDHLGSDFRALEWYGAEMRRVHGEGTRRSIKFEDELEGLCIDIKVPSESEWHRINPETAKDYKKRLQGSTSERARAVLEVWVNDSRASGLARAPLSGANSIPLVTPPVLSSTALLSNAAGPSSSLSQRSTSSQPTLTQRRQAVETPPMIIHSPDEIIYITPKKRQP